MVPGHQPLASLEAELRKERRAIEELDGRASEASNRRVEIAAAQARAFRALARLRAGSLSSETPAAVTGELDASEQQASALLRQRQEEGQRLASDLDAAEEGRAALEEERKAAARRLDDAAAVVDAAEARTQARLQDDPTYRAQLAQAREAERIAMHAEEKATRSEQELQQKGSGYRSDPLFRYLWRRRYGTADYRAAALFRWLDGKVARLIGYLDARVDYARLLEIPKRLREHAVHRRQDADAAFEALRALDQRAREADGIPALEAAEAEAVDGVAAIDQRLGQAATEVQSLLERRRQMAAGEDETYQRAIEVLVTGLRSEELTSLQRDAQATPFQEDDALIAELSELQEEQDRLATAGEELKSALRQRRDHLRELEELQAEYKRRQYDQPGHGFEDGALVATVLANVLRGMLQRDALWRVLEQQARYRPSRTKTSFGSGGFGRGSPWGGGLRRGGGGGFRTGGGGRGGGFRTGGKF